MTGPLYWRSDRVQPHPMIPLICLRHHIVFVKALVHDIGGSTLLPAAGFRWNYISIGFSTPDFKYYHKILRAKHNKY